MKKMFFVAFMLIIVFSIAYTCFIFFYQKDKGKYCGDWGVWDQREPTCKCSGEIVRRGGPSGPADDSGGYYECLGEIIE